MAIFRPVPAVTWILTLALTCAARGACFAQAPITAGELRRPNVVVVLRHAHAPGVSDPAGFRLDDCATQRNLDTRGRRQAAALGAAWRANGFQPTRIMSSAWCRCQDTARLMGLGPVMVQPLLNSFFGAEASARAGQTARLARYIEGLDPRGGPYLLVTHQVVITALTGHGADSAGGVAIELPVDGRARQVRILEAGTVD